MSNLAAVERYTYSLFEIACEKDMQDQIAGELKLIADAFLAEPRLEAFFESKSIRAEEKSALLNDLVEKNAFSDYTRNFFNLLLENKRFGYDSPKLAWLTFNDCLIKKKGIRRGRIVLTRALGVEEQKALEEKISGKLGYQVQLDFQVDENLIDGSYLEIEGVVYEDTLKRRLSNLREWMKG